MVYQWRTGAVVKASAEDAGAQCEALAVDNKLTPKNLVDVNRPDDAPLHNAFEWKDDIAAEKWRESQAQYIIRSVVCVVEEQPDPTPVRAFVRVVDEPKNYTPYTVVLRHQDMKEVLLNNARRDMESFTNRYRSLCEMSKVVQVMDETLKTTMVQNINTVVPQAETAYNPYREVAI